MKAEVYQLLNMLEDEFRNCLDVRVIPVFPSTLIRSPDLKQDYDPESSNLHKKSGIKVYTLNKEFFFPVDWIKGGRSPEYYKQIETIKSIAELAL